MQYSRELTVSFLCLLLSASSGRAAITIDGVADKKVYADRVTFTVRSEAGSDATATLNGVPVATDVPVKVDEPEYYELSVHQRQRFSGVEESRLVQFIVRATERANSEWGLPPWTPYPPIDSAAAEFAGATLTIVTPAQYPTGLEIPIIARVEDTVGNRVGVNGAVTAVGFQNRPLPLLRGVGSVLLPAAPEPNTISYTAEIHTLATPKKIVIENSTSWQIVPVGTVNSTNWGENARIRISGKLTIAAGATLTIGSGSVILLDPGVGMAVEGHIVVNGTTKRPVVFTCQNRSSPWGGLVFEKGTSRGDFTGTIFTGSGADADWFSHNPGHGSSHRHEEPLLYVSNGAHLTLTDCSIVENHGQAGHGEGGYLTMTRCLVQKCISAGQYNSGAVTLDDCAVIEFPSAAAPFADDDNDALYLTGGAHSLTNCLIGWSLDDGVDAGSGSAGSVTVRHCWFESSYHEAMAWSEPRIATVVDTVALNCGQGIECGFGSPDVNAVHCLSTANVVGARFGDNYDWTYDGFLKVRDSLLLFNQRDIWGRAWDNWTVHLSQMDLRDNYVTTLDIAFPDNRLWNPLADANQLDELIPFLPTPAGKVGIGLATWEDALDLAAVSQGIPVRLSTFTVNPVAVDYAIDSGKDHLAAGTLHFTPGETVKLIPIETLALENLSQVQVTLSNPINADLTGRNQITYRGTPAPLPLVKEGDEWRYFKGTAEPPASWNVRTFDDHSWLTGPTPIGYEADTGYETQLATNLGDMHNKYLSVYARRQFSIEDPMQVTRLIFTMDYDDGYIAYLNGVQVAARSAPASPKYNQPATASHEACCGTTAPTGPCPPEQIDLTDHVKDLVAGVNVLAVQVHNQSLSSSDFLFIPELFSTTAP
jgi:hypothetical protein